MRSRSVTARRRAVAVGVGVLAALAPAGCGVGQAEQVRPPIVAVRTTPPAPAVPVTPEAVVEVAPPAAAPAQPVLVPLAEPEPSTAPEPAPAEAAPVVEDQVVALANAARQEAGLAPLDRVPEIDAVARGWSTYLATQGRDLAHNPDYSAQIPPGWSAAAENVGWVQDGGRFGPEEVAARIHAGWMDSPGHRANLLNPGYTHIGVGVAHSPAHGYYLTQDFAAY